jgi:hypothetical protein
MLNYLRKNHQVFILFIIFYCLTTVICVYIFVFRHQNLDTYLGLPYLTDYFNKILLKGGAKIFVLIFTIISLLFLGFYIVRICINYIIIQYRTQFPAIFFITVSSFIFYKELFSPAIIGAIFLLITIDRLVSTIEDQEISFKYIDAGILIAIGSFFYLNMIFFLPFLWISQITLRKFNIREFLFTVVGFIIPILYVFSMFFIFNKPVLEILGQIFKQFGLKKEIIMSPVFLTGLSVYSAFLIFASFFAIKKYTTAKIQSRKLYQLLLYLFINTLAVYFLVPSAGMELFFVIAIPSSVLFSIFFSECQSNFINDFIFIVLLLVPIGIFIFNAKWFQS